MTDWIISAVVYVVISRVTVSSVQSGKAIQDLVHVIVLLVGFCYKIKMGENKQFFFILISLPFLFLSYVFQYQMDNFIIVSFLELQSELQKSETSR